MPFSDIRGQDRAVRMLRAAIGRGRVHHAYLFAGPEGVGKELLARTFAQALDCEKGDGDACGACVACRKIAHGNHPDVRLVMPEAEAVARKLLAKADIEGTPSRDIRVEQVRDLRAKLALKAVEGRRRVAILVPADRMNPTAQNVLLKTLEEPPPDTTLILISSASDALLPTIRSRCARVLFGPLPEGVVPRKVDVREEERRRALLARMVELADAAQAVSLAQELNDRDSAEEAVKLLERHFRDRAAASVGAEARAALARLDACARAREGLTMNGNPRLMMERCFLEGL